MKIWNNNRFGMVYVVYNGKSRRSGQCELLGCSLFFSVDVFSFLQFCSLQMCFPIYSSRLLQICLPIYRCSKVGPTALVKRAQNCVKLLGLMQIAFGVLVASVKGDVATSKITTWMYANDEVPLDQLNTSGVISGLFHRGSEKGQPSWTIGRKYYKRELQMVRCCPNLDVAYQQKLRSFV